MASPYQPSKKTVDLAAPVVRASRIRRDPPPPVKVVSATEIKERDARNLLVGVVVIALAVFVILIGFSKFAGWSPRDYTINIR